MIKASISFLKSNQKLLLQIALAFISILLGVYFIRQEETELVKVKQSLAAADLRWFLAGIFLLLLFVVVQGLMYQYSFKAIHQKIRLSTGIALFLKRNLVSVFLPAGMLTNLFFFNKEIQKKEGINKTQTYFASSIFSFCSILSSILVGLPALLWLFFKSHLSSVLVLGIGLTILLIGGLTFAIYNIFQQGALYRWLKTKTPGFFQVIDDLRDQTFDQHKFWQVLGLSCVIELIGIGHLYIAIEALGGHANLEVAYIGYAIVLLLLMSSPFLRGIGAIEVTLTYALTLFGFTTVAAISIAFLFRFFEFWGVLLLGLVALIAKRDNALLRLLPTFLLLGLGIVNILSALTPAVPQRLKILHEFLPLAAINASVYLVLLSGIIMLGVAVYLLRGLRIAWIVALLLSLISLMAHLTKGIDWEEASIALITLVSLIYQRKQYFIQPDFRLAKKNWQPAAIAVLSVWIFGTLAFYFLNPRHFNADFTLWESFKETITTFFLLNIDLLPVTRFGQEFLLGMHILGGSTLIFMALIFLRPFIQRAAISTEEERQLAKALVDKYGKSSLDYFKTYGDKKFWFGPDKNSFVAFKTSRDYAIVLENPVAANDAAIAETVKGFDAYCRQNGLRSAYYRIPEEQVQLYEKLNKKLLPIGEEAVVNLTTFNIQGKDKAAMRNAVNKLTKLGYALHTYEPPQKDGFIQQLKAVSDDWLKDMNRSELVFSQGLFDEKELKNQTIFTLENEEGKIFGFVNQVSDFTRAEANFDLMRKTADAPNGTMDFLFIKMFEYFRTKGYRTCNLGLVPMSGIDKPENLQEQVIKLAYERIRQFGHYKSLFHFKEKFEPEWKMMYFAYTSSMDMVQLPGALEKVIQV